MAKDSKPIPIEEALDAARKGIREQKPFLDAQAEVYSSSGKASDAILVERIDSIDMDSYYLVSWTFRELVVAIVQVDALSGSFLGASMLANPIKSPFLSLDDAKEKAIAEDASKKYGAPRYVWRPCRESTNPTNPFCEVPYESGAVFVTMTGDVLSELTSLGRGG